MYFCEIQHNGFSVWNWRKTVKARCLATWLATGSWVVQPAKGHVRSTCGGSKVSMSDSIFWVARDLANLRLNSRDALLAYFMCFSSFLYPHYKNSHYSQNCKESFREKTLEIHLRVRDCKLTIRYTFLLVFFTLFPL